MTCHSLFSLIKILKSQHNFQEFLSLKLGLKTNLVMFQLERNNRNYHKTKDSIRKLRFIVPHYRQEKKKYLMRFHLSKCFMWINLKILNKKWGCRNLWKKLFRERMSITLLKSFSHFKLMWNLNLSLRKAQFTFGLPSLVAKTQMTFLTFLWYSNNSNLILWIHIKVVQRS